MNKKIAFPIKFFSIITAFIFLSSQICFAEMGKNPTEKKDYKSTAEYQKWKKDLKSCEKKKVLSIVSIVAGAGVTAAGIMISIHEFNRGTGAGADLPAVVGGVIGVTLIGGGIHSYITADVEENRLKGKGKRKGYLSLNYNHETKTPALAFNYNF